MMFNAWYPLITAETDGMAFEIASARNDDDHSLFMFVVRMSLYVWKSNHHVAHNAPGNVQHSEWKRIWTREAKENADFESEENDGMLCKMGAIEQEWSRCVPSPLRFFCVAMFLSVKLWCFFDVSVPVLMCNRCVCMLCLVPSVFHFSELAVLSNFSSSSTTYVVAYERRSCSRCWCSCCSCCSCTLQVITSNTYDRGRVISSRNLCNLRDKTCGRVECRLTKRMIYSVLIIPPASDSRFWTPI